MECCKDCETKKPEPPANNKLPIVGIMAVLLLAIAGIWMASTQWGAAAAVNQPAANPGAKTVTLTKTDGSTVQVPAQQNAPPSGQVQEVAVRALSNGAYDKTTITVKKGIPVHFTFSADPGAGCGRVLYIPDFNVKLTSINGESQSAAFTPTKAGNYAYRCSMNMFRGVLVVTD